ncbi:hypothetical protein, partial [Vibrio harveyi]
FAKPFTKAVNQAKGSQATFKDLHHAFYAAMAPKAYFEIKDVEAVHVMAEEVLYYNTGTKIIFPESEALLDSLRCAKFDLVEGHPVDFPFESFSVAMPKNYVRDGVEFMPFLVSWMTGDEYRQKATKPFDKITKL